MNYIEKLCVEKDLKLTSQRKVIAEVLTSAKDHPDADKVYERANMIDKNISLATVYRTLSLFEQYGMIKKLEIGNGKARYEQFKKCDEHYHLIDVETETIIEFKSEELDKIKEKIAKNLGYKLINSNLELYGIPLKNQKK
ncbi:MAG: Fur family ferric uptake transcriptional regulator [Candidatus Midichloriaceae bacterium]|jgi:Fur family ferric uptake transcriptional regulator